MDQAIQRYDLKPAGETSSTRLSSLEKLNRSSLYLPFDERLSLFLTLLAFVGIGFEFASTWGYDLHDQYTVYRRVITILSLQALHVTLTFVGLWFFPDFRTWVHRHSGGRPDLFWLKIFAVTTVLFGLCLFVSNRAFYSPLLRGHVVDVVFILILWVSAHHRMSQTFGLSLAYRQAQEKDARISRNHVVDRFWNRIERACFWTLLATIGPLFAIGLDLYRRPLEAWQIQVSYEAAGRVFDIFMALSVWCALCLLALSILESRRYPDRDHRLRIIHNSRYLFYPLASLSVLAFLVMEALHGLEYVFIWRKMNANLREKPKWGWSLNTAIAIGFVVLFYLAVQMPRVGLTIGIPADLFDRSLVALQTAITFTHFYLDRLLFRMRDPVSREIVGPLLAGSDRRL